MSATLTYRFPDTLNHTRDSLWQNNWLDNGTISLLFEQTFFNPALNCFFHLKSSFERTPGGAMYHKKQVNQLRNQPFNDKLFFVAIAFCLSTLIEIVFLARDVCRKKYPAKCFWRIIGSFLLVIINICIIFFWTYRQFRLTSAMVLFELDPRSIPPFSMV